MITGNFISKDYQNLIRDSSDPIDTTETKQLSLDPVKWTTQTRFVRNNVFTFDKRPYLLPIYRDSSQRIYIKKGRQTEISELLINLILHNGWKYPGTTHNYLADRQSHTYKFSNIRMKIEAIQKSPLLQKIIQLKNHTTTQMIFNNGSVANFLSSWNGFIESESIPADFTYVDEIQNTELENFASLLSSMDHSDHKRLYGVGIGTIEGSEWDKLFKQTTYSSWNNESQSWIPKNPNAKWSGYRLPQTLVPYITAAEIEAKRLEFPPAKFAIQVMGDSVKGDAVPLALSDIQKVQIPNLSWTMPANVDHLAGPVFIGLDWGGGTKAYTVAFIGQYINIDIPIWRLLYATRIADTNTEDQIRKVSNLIDAYNPIMGVQDLGGGTRQMQEIDNKYGHSIVKCNFAAPIQDPIQHDKLYSHNLIKVNRSYALEAVFDQIKRPYIDDLNKAIYRAQIPRIADKDIAWLMDDYTSMYGENAKTASGQEYIRYDKAPESTNDGLMANVYFQIAFTLWKRNNQNNTSVAYN